MGLNEEMAASEQLFNRNEVAHLTIFSRPAALRQCRNVDMEGVPAPPEKGWFVSNRAPLPQATALLISGVLTVHIKAEQRPF